MFVFSAFVWLIIGVNSQSEPECKLFRDIYDSGKELCENMWDDAFVYTENTSDAYTMWFFDSVNPNDAVSRTLNWTNDTIDECYLNYFHLDVTAEADNYTECHPWQKAACCAQDTVASVDKLLMGYGDEYRWDRCGELSQACERFFVQEACFYECSPHIGLYRVNGTHDWKIYGMPIKADYCDAWWRACKNDYFCSSDDGDYFSCAMEYAEADAATDDDEETSVVWIVVVIVIGAACLGLLAFLCFIRFRERDGGQAYFAKMLEESGVEKSEKPAADGDASAGTGNTETPTTR